ncbi:KIAA0226 [Cordylochernes scorpioides]|uniref:KIAA0226 n=1 Tax=Cordylochernes scorpioides TaxID=51811 RepID=A0ABY6LAM1_9ARAC|nr:KIAA0226 [Cordylochernes scorpioides]
MDYQYVTTQRGGTALIINGHRYNKVRDGREGTIYWRCAKDRHCPGRAVTWNNRIKKVNNLHNHPPRNSAAAAAAAATRRFNAPPDCEALRQEDPPILENLVPSLAVLKAFMCQTWVSPYSKPQDDCTLHSFYLSCLFAAAAA